MYTQLNEEMNKTPLTVKILLGLAILTTGILLILFIVFMISFSDLGTLINDGTKTLTDLQEIMPEIKHSLQLIQNICKKNKNFC